MTTATYRNYSGGAADLYQSFFVPRIATPVSGELLDRAQLRSGDRVVDVACGTGVITRAAAERVGPTGYVTGVDIAPDMIAVAEATPAAGAPIEWQTGDAAALPLPNDLYDVALCQMSLMFIEDRPAALAEMCRVLGSGGRVVVNTPGRIQPLFEAMEEAIVDNIDPQLGAFVRVVFSMHDPELLSGLLADAGFADVASAEYTVRLELPEPDELLWNYVNLTPMAPLVAQAPEAAQKAMEDQFVRACASLPGVATAFDQPMAIAWGLRP